MIRVCFRDMSGVLFLLLSLSLLAESEAKKFGDITLGEITGWVLYILLSRTWWSYWIRFVIIATTCAAVSETIKYKCCKSKRLKSWRDVGFSIIATFLFATGLWLLVGIIWVCGYICGYIFGCIEDEEESEEKEMTAVNIV